MDQIVKLQPHRTMHLQGFDAFGAAAALWGASDAGFTVSGIFRDLADFAVLVLFEMDDPFGHPRFSYLADGNFNGLVLDFDMEFQGIQAFESVKFPWTDWAYLDCQDQNGVGYRTSLKGLATAPTGRTGASGTFTLEGTSQGPGDEVTLCCLGQAFSSAGLGATRASVDIPIHLQGGGTSSCVQAIWWQAISCVQAMWGGQGSSYVHSVTIGNGAGSHTYSVTEDSLSSGQIASEIAAQIASYDPWCTASAGGTYGNEITVTVRDGVDFSWCPINVSSSDGSGSAALGWTRHFVQVGGVYYAVNEDGLSSAQLASNIADQINASDPNCAASVGGEYGNEITVTLRAGVAGAVYVFSSDGSAGANLTSSSYSHSITIGASTYSVVEDGLTIQQITDNLAGQINASDSNCTAVSDTASGSNGGVTLTLKSGVDGPVAITSSDSFSGATLQVVSAAAVCAALASAINAYAWTSSYAIPALTATASDNQITITAAPGADGNMITWDALAATSNLYFTPGAVQLAGGSSDRVSWHVTVDFNAVIWTNTNTGGGASGITNLQKLWITFAPALGNGAAYAPTEWQVNVTNWSVTDPNGVRPLKVAGPGSVRIEEDDPWVVRAGYWEDPAIVDPKVSAYWSRGRAIRSAYSATEARTLTTETHCQSTHDIYLGTRFDTNCGIVSATLDGGTPVTLDCYGAPTTNQTRRLLFSGVAAGRHQVVITLTSNKNASSSGWYFYFDFLECAVLSDVPDAPEIRTDVGLATDFDTDSTYKLSPQRLIWNLQKLGLVGEIDHYVGVFWWNQRKASGGKYPSAMITLSGTWTPGCSLLMNLGGSVAGGNVSGGASISIPVQTGDTLDTLAARLAHSINATLVGVWASASGATVTITCQSTGANWMYSLIVWAISGGTITVSHGVVATITGTSSAYTSSDLETGAADPEWIIDPTVTPVLNRGCRDWHTDYFAALKAAGLGATVSFSQELVNPPDDPANGAVWVQRFPDGTAATTDTGFANLKSSMCALGTAVQNYMAPAYIEMAQLMLAGSFTLPRLQFGEVLWWYIAASSGMAFYDADTVSAAQTALGRALHTFLTANDDPSVNSYADANFLRSRLASYVLAVQAAILTSVPASVFELLWPLDVNDPNSRPLLHYVNLPPDWQTRPGSQFDTFLCEGFQYGGVDHNLDEAQACASYPFDVLSWDRAYCRYLGGWYNPGWPWVREFQAAQRTGVPLIKFWAYDHLCLYGWPLPLPKQPPAPAFL